MLRELIDMIFKKKPIINEESISRIKDIVPMPSRSEFANDSRKQALIDEYKKEYLKTLRLARTITSVDIMPEELHDYQSIYYDLLMNLFKAEESEVSFDRIDEVKDEELDLSIKCLKLRLYLSNVRELIIETKLRLIALDEILKEKKLSKTRENAVLNEINNLLHSLFIFQSQEWSMIKVIHDNLIVIKNIDLKTFLENIDNPNIEKANDEVVNKRLEEVREMALIVIPDIVGYLESLNLSPKVLIATLEQELEMYVYTHKDDLNKLREENENLCHIISKNTRTLGKEIFISSIQYDKKIAEVKEKKQEYLDRLKELELRYKIFSKYGRNLVIKEELKELYESKFKVLIIDILDSGYYNFPNDISTIEFEIYQDIIFSFINEITNGKNSYVNELACINKINASKLINLIMKFLRNGNRELNIKNILYDRLIMSFLIALNKRELEEFFDNIKQKKESYPEINFYDYIDDAFSLFMWHEYLPLRTIFNIAECNMETDTYNNGGPFIVQKMPLYQIYRLASKTFTEEKWLEGLIAIRPHYLISKHQETLFKVREYYSSKFPQEFELPSTLKILMGNFFDNSSIKSLYLNDGIEKVNNFSIPNLEYLSVPESLDTLINTPVKIIFFRNYEDSVMLHSRDLMGRFLHDSLSKYGGFTKDSKVIDMKFQEIQILVEPGRVITIKNSDLFKYKPDNWDSLHFSQQITILYKIFEKEMQKQLEHDSTIEIKRG